MLEISLKLCPLCILSTPTPTQTAANIYFIDSTPTPTTAKTTDSDSDFDSYSTAPMISIHRIVNEIIAARSNEVTFLLDYETI